jgi:ParB family chromosome partitioning protein
MTMRRSLGRGLEALIPTSVRLEQYEEQTPVLTRDAGAGQTRDGLLMVAPEAIAPGRFQPRKFFDETAIEELAAASKAQGVIEPLVVRRTGETYELIAGERRLRAARLAGLDTVPVIIRNLDDRAALEMSLVENLLREDLNVVEEGGAFARLNREFGLTHEAIAERVGKSRSYVTNMIRLIDLPPEVLAMLGRGELTAGQVRPLLALDSADTQLAEARKIVDGKLSSRDAEEIASVARAVRQGRVNVPNGGDIDPNLRALVDTMQRALRRKVRVIRGRGKTPGRVELEFYDDDDLTGLARLLAAHT